MDNLATLLCRAQVGLEAPLVEVEVTVASGLPAFHLVGLPATVVKESRERVRAALLSCGFEFPAGHIVVNLAPAELPKGGGRFELPIALGILIASGQLPRFGAPDGRACELYGELGLGGEIKPVRGIVLAAAHASRDGHELIVPAANADEALIAATTPIRAASHLKEVCRHLTREERLRVHAAPAASRAPPPQACGLAVDVSDVRGQFQAKRALLIAAAGGHSLLLIGPPGCGKSMLAQRLPGLLPPLTEGEALDCAAIASVSTAGFSLEAFGRRPFRSPHHTASPASVVGGGAHARPGEISLAHNGVLFLDELPEFDRQVLEALREPLEAGVVRVARAAVHADYPAQFQLIAAMNPCPCGYLDDRSGGCRCTPTQAQRYRARISGPLLDRLDMHVEVPRLQTSDFEDGIAGGESTAVLAARVRTARSRQLRRQGRCNARLSDAQIERCCILQSAARSLLERAMQRLRFTGRTRQRIVRLARTIADLDGADAIADRHVGEAVMLRCLDRERATSSCR